MLPLTVVVVLVRCLPNLTPGVVFFVYSTGNFSIIALDHMKKLKNIAFVGNTGHFDIETNFVALTVR